MAISILWANLSQPEHALKKSLLTKATVLWKGFIISSLWWLELNTYLSFVVSTWRVIASLSRLRTFGNTFSGQASSNISTELCFWRPDKQKVEWRPSCGGVLYLLREICGSLPQLVAVSFCPLDGTCSRFCLRVFGRKLLLQSTLMKAMNRKWVSGTTQREVIINPLVNYKGESHSHLTQAFESRQF